MKYAYVSTDFDDSKFKPLPKSPLFCDANLTQVRDNMFTLFKLRFTSEQLEAMSQEVKDQTFGAGICDYAWMSEVENKFKTHAYHKKFFKHLDDTKLTNTSRYSSRLLSGVRWWWSLQTCPVTLDNVLDLRSGIIEHNLIKKIKECNNTDVDVPDFVGYITDFLDNKYDLQTYYKQCKGVEAL